MSRNIRHIKQCGLMAEGPCSPLNGLGSFYVPRQGTGLFFFTNGVDSPNGPSGIPRKMTGLCHDKKQAKSMPNPILLYETETGLLT